MKLGLLTAMGMEMILAFGGEVAPAGTSSAPAPGDRFDRVIVECSAHERLDPRFVKAVIAAESEFHPMAVSSHGARGLMQLMPQTAEEMGTERSAMIEPKPNILAGTAYLNLLYKALRLRYGIKAARLQDAPPWAQRRVLAAYNAGPKYLYRRSDHWPGQTRRYVRKVMRLRRMPSSVLVAMGG